MSGPIVRKYGFPNFENIFGHRELQHGVDEPEDPAPEPVEQKPAESRGSDETQEIARPAPKDPGATE